MTHVELLPCPFCGSSRLAFESDIRLDKANVLCTQCGAIAKDSVWNTRTPLPATGSAVPASTVAPAPVGEGQPVAWRWKLESARDWVLAKRPFPEDHAWGEKVICEPLYLAAQAPKPASGGGEQLSHSDGGVPAATCPCCGGSIDWDYWGETGRARCKQCRLEALSLSNWNRRAIAAEADTAKEPNPKDSVEFIGEMIGCRAILSGVIIPPAPVDSSPPAADRLAQTVTDAETRQEFIRRLNYTSWMEGMDNGCEPPKDWQDGFNACLKRESIRARESAPAQEPTVYVETRGLDCVLNAGACVLSAYKPANAVFMSMPLTPLYAAAPRAGE